MVAPRFWNSSHRSRSRPTSPAAEHELARRRPKGRWGTYMAQVTVAEDLFDAQGEREDDYWLTSPAFLVRCGDLEGALQALLAAIPRLYRVDADGTELPGAEVTAGLGITPNSVNGVYRTPDGLVVDTDTKGGLSSGMAEGMVRILTEELLARDLT